MLTREQISLVTKHLHNKLWNETGNSYSLIYNYDYILDKHIFRADHLSFLSTGIAKTFLNTVEIGKNHYQEIFLTNAEISYILL